MLLFVECLDTVAGFSVVPKFGLVSLLFKIRLVIPPSFVEDVD
jgi:hypothetical protein